PERRSDIQPWCRAPTSAALAFDRADNFGVKSESGAEREPAVVDAPEPDSAVPARARCVEDFGVCFDRVTWQPQRTSEDVCAAARDDRQQRRALDVCTAVVMREQAVDDFVDRAVATEYDDDIKLVSRC